MVLILSQIETEPEATPRVGGLDFVKLALQAADLVGEPVVPLVKIVNQGGQLAETPIVWVIVAQPAAAFLEQECSASALLSLSLRFREEAP